MKVADLITKLSRLNPDEDICVLLYGRSQFSNPDERVWAGVCNDFENWETVGDDIGQFLSGMIRERSTI